MAPTAPTAATVAPVQPAGPPALIPPAPGAKVTAPLFGGYRGGRKRKDGLVPGSPEALAADREKDRLRKERQREREGAAAEPPPLPGVAGAIALILVLCMSAILPINTAGLALVGMAIGLFIADIFAPTHGVLTFGGILSFFLGSLMLFNRGDEAFRLSLVYIIPATLVTAAFFTFVVAKGMRAQSLPVRSGKETMLGKTAPALARIDGASGKVFVEGEYWNAISDVPIEPGQAVVITSIDGLTLKVKPKQT